ncbi:AbrB/MazE/SpoVT family DNA-binding domain-containing protein [Archaeoglobales archaeon]|nr:MAG: AbrB/MazE/SpoVT family DNA-binding domain-containing protein [Archaeoglobales archaeon]
MLVVIRKNFIFWENRSILVLNMSLEVPAKIGKKYALYLPKSVVDLLKVREGDRVKISVEGEKMIVEVIRDPIDLALYGKKFAKISAEEVERISLEEQGKYEGSA